MTAESLAQLVWALASLVAVGGFWLYAIVAVLITKRSMFQRQQQDTDEDRRSALHLASR